MKTHITTIGYDNVPPVRRGIVWRSDGSKRVYVFPNYNKFGMPCYSRWWPKMERAWRKRSKTK